jgi:hypothetical protein
MEQWIIPVILISVMATSKASYKHIETSTHISKLKFLTIKLLTRNNNRQNL